jgi:hypothetical protein
MSDRYLLIERGEIIGSIFIDSDTPGRSALDWRDENKPSAVVGMVLGGEDEAWLDKFPVFQ